MGSGCGRGLLIRGGVEGGGSGVVDEAEDVGGGGVGDEAEDVGGGMVGDTS